MLRTTLIASLLVLGGGALAVSASRSIQGQSPGAEHKQVLEGVGNWEGTLTTFMGGAGEPMRASESVVAVGEFWTQATFTCDFMGMPYVGTGCVGYDAAAKKYVGTWVDSTSSYLALMEGQMDPKTKTLTMRWKAPDPVSGEMVPHRSESVGTADARTSTFFMGEGAGTKTMVIAMKRTSARSGGK